MFPNNVQHPLFAPATQKAQTDDIDFNEIFAEYFINEFDDPLNAYTNSMANYNGVTFSAVHEGNSIPIGMTTSVPEVVSSANGPISLPTGGIKTLFHGSVEKQSLASPASKKPRIEDNMTSSMSTLLLHPGMAMMTNQQVSMDMPKPVPTISGSQLSLPVSGSQAGLPGSSSQVGLPVGVGIRLGGVGGIAPATAQATARSPGVQTQYSMWGMGDIGASDHVVAERRQRNREHAKRSRVRKKFMLESLQEQVRGLQKENQRLRMIVQEHIPEHAVQIMAECCTDNPLFIDNDDSQDSSQEGMERVDRALVDCLITGQKCFVLSDPKLPDNPIVFASEGFYKLTGYTSKEVLGRNCRFLQGPATDQKTVEIIRKAVASGSDCTVCILNYRADGTPFWNQFFLAALRDSDNSIVNYVGVQTEVEPDTGANALEEKVNAVMPLQFKDDRDSS